MEICQKMTIDAMQKYHKIQHFHKKITTFYEHTIFRVMALSEFSQKRKMCQNMFLSTMEGTLAEFDVTQRENDTRRPDRHRCDPVVGSMSRKAWRTNDAYNAELLRTCLSSFFKQAENVRKRWKKNPRLSGNHVALCRGYPADIKKMRAERFELPTF